MLIPSCHSSGLNLFVRNKLPSVAFYLSRPFLFTHYSILKAMGSQSMETNVKLVKSVMGAEIPEPCIVKALSQCNNDADAAVNLILDSSSPLLTVHKTLTSTGGTRISTFQVNLTNNLEESGRNNFLDGCINEKEGFLSVGNDKVMGVLEGGEEGILLETGTEKCDFGFLKGEGVGETLPNDQVKVENPVESSEGSEEKSFVLLEEKKVLIGEKYNRSVAISGFSCDDWLRFQGNDNPIENEDRNLKMNGGTKVETGVKQEPIEETACKSVVLFVEREILSHVKSEPLVEKSGLNCYSIVEDETKLEDGMQIAVKVKDEPNEGSEKIGLHEKLNYVVSERKPDVSKGVKVETENKEHNDGCESKSVVTVNEQVKELTDAEPLRARKLSDYEYSRLQMQTSNKRPKKNTHDEMRLSTVVIEDGDFPEEPDWLLVGRTVITGLSTTRGRKLENNEIVHFAFPKNSTSSSSRFVSAKAAHAASSIVRFSTKRSGEIGRLPMEWAKCLVPLVNSSKVKVLGRCIAAPVNLQMMQEIMLYVSFYIHHTIFTGGDLSSWKLEHTSIDTTTYPLLTLFKLLKVIPFQKAEFTPEELDSRKRSLKLDDDLTETASVLPLAKRIKGIQDKNDKDEQAISESALNKLVGAVDVYNLEEMEPPETLTCDLRPYQKQALYWMSEIETGVMVEEAGKTLHPCWAAYRVGDERAPAIYVNIFSGEATTQFPTATQTARGGILADAMGLGKTVMTISLILARRGKGRPEDEQVFIEEDENKAKYIRNRQRDSTTMALEKVKGGTLIICPMALLSQWNDELEAHSKPETISVFVHYGGDRSNDPRVLAEPDVVLTTYGVLTAAYKKDSGNSIFHRIEWHRVVLDEAHTIKSSKTQGAQAAFALSSHCRWCLTGTPLQNNLEDLYGLLYFLHVEPWCNWVWWSKLIQRPYENGDQRGLKLVKAILRPLMLRRTKESKDKEGRPILVLPPTDIKVIECDQSEEEHDFYDALFKRSKVQFDQFVAQGKVLHNYANILELLLRLRQCCNHPFLVMSRGDAEKYADLDKLARRFLHGNNPDLTSQTGPSRAYVEEVVENLRSGENAECPICLESADDPVLTPCAHRMCRECLLSSWRTPAYGICPICRQMLNKSELITCPSGGRFRVDVEKNWNESSKISKLMDCLERLRGSGEKSIVFSQWTSFLDLLEIPLKRRKFGFLRFDGKCSQKQRTKILHEFAETDEKMVLLMSLKAGGVGLNLTAASNVFLMDPWWNPAVEEQAIMRIHRIGQKRTVRVRRFIVKDTVEERLQQVQARKQRMVVGALTDEEVRSARLEELKMLFK